jgi:2-oxoglutarate ferredoxin oxidoreductase subunit delta
LSLPLALPGFFPRADSRQTVDKRDGLTYYYVHSSGADYERKHQMNEEKIRQTDAPEETHSPASSEKDKAQPSLRAKVIVFDNWCKGCGLCVAFCPRDVLEMSNDGRVHVVAPDRCIACHWCDTHCPDFAILVRPLDEDPSRRQGQ